MTSNEENADADPGAETTIGPPAADETELMAPTEAAPTVMAWSAAEAPVLPASRSWRLALGISAGAVLGAALLAGTVGLTAWALRPQPSAPSGSTTLTEMLPPLPPPVTVTAAPPTKTWTPPPTTTTVTVQAAPRPPVADPSPDENDEAFFSALRRSQIRIYDQSKVLFGAHWVCGQLDGGQSKIAMINAVKRLNPDLTEMGAIDFVADSVVYYYPRYEG
jgi:Protein of unknown function (DUF732)